MKGGGKLWVYSPLGEDQREVDSFLSTMIKAGWNAKSKLQSGAAISMEYKTGTRTTFERKCLELMFSYTKMEKRNIRNNKTERER